MCTILCLHQYFTLFPSQQNCSPPLYCSLSQHYPLLLLLLSLSIPPPCTPRSTLSHPTQPSRTGPAALCTDCAPLPAPPLHIDQQIKPVNKHLYTYAHCRQGSLTLLLGSAADYFLRVEVPQIPLHSSSSSSSSSNSK